VRSHHSVEARRLHSDSAALMGCGGCRRAELVLSVPGWAGWTILSIQSGEAAGVFDLLRSEYRTEPIGVSILRWVHLSALGECAGDVETEFVEAAVHCCDDCGFLVDGGSDGCGEAERLIAPLFGVRAVGD